MPAARSSIVCSALLIEIEFRKTDQTILLLSSGFRPSLSLGCDRRAFPKVIPLAAMPITTLIDSARSVNGRPFSELSLPFTSIGEMLQSRAASTPQKIWLVFYDEDATRITFTYAQF